MIEFISDTSPKPILPSHISFLTSQGRYFNHVRAQFICRKDLRNPPPPLPDPPGERCHGDKRINGAEWETMLVFQSSEHDPLQVNSGLKVDMLDLDNRCWIYICPGQFFFPSNARCNPISAGRGSKASSFLWEARRTSMRPHISSF